MASATCTSNNSFRLPQHNSLQALFHRRLERSPETLDAKSSEASSRKTLHEGGCSVTNSSLSRFLPPDTHYDDQLPALCSTRKVAPHSQPSRQTNHLERVSAQWPCFRQSTSHQTEQRHARKSGCQSDANKKRQLYDRLCNYFYHGNADQPRILDASIPAKDPLSLSVLPVPA